MTNSHISFSRSFLVYRLKPFLLRQRPNVLMCASIVHLFDPFTTIYFVQYDVLIQQIWTLHHYHHWLPFEVYYPTTDLNYPKTGLQLITSSLTKFRRNLYLSFLSRPTSKRSSNGPLSRSKMCFFLPSCTTMLTPTYTSTVSFPLIRSSKSFWNYDVFLVNLELPLSNPILSSPFDIISNAGNRSISNALDYLCLFINLLTCFTMALTYLLSSALGNLMQVC